MLDPVTPETLIKSLPDFPYKLPAGEGSDSDCGARLFTLTEAVPVGIEWFQLDTGTLEMSIQPTNSLLLGIHTFYLKVVLAKFPGLKNAVTVPFKVEIIYKCDEVVFALTGDPIPLIFHQVGENVVKYAI